ncbi:COG4648 family protein [Dongia sp. agr-C8]
MRFWPSKARILAIGPAAAAGIAYPFAVYFYRDRLPASAFVTAALLLLGLQIMVLRPSVARLWRVPLLISAALTVAIALLDQNVAREAYPVVCSLAAASVFGWTLVSPPSLIERFARLTRPHLPETAIRYCRNVTVIWAVWLAANAAIATALVARGDLMGWAIWTGLLSYLISGLLFAGEFGYRLLFLEGRKRP